MALAAVPILAALVFANRAAGQHVDEASLERLIDSGKLQQAQAALDQAVAARGQTPGMIYLKAKILFKERKNEESIRTLEPLFGTAPTSFTNSSHEAWRRVLEGQQPAALTLMGMNHVLLGNLEQAEPFLVVAAEKQSSDSNSQFRLALLYYTTNRFTQAAESARAVIRLRPSFGKAYEILGLSLEELRRMPEAIVAFRKAIALNASTGIGDPSPHVSLGKALLTQAEYPESAAALRRALKLAPRSPEANFLLGKVLYKTEAFDESEPLLRRSIALAADYAEPRYLLSMLLTRLGRSQEAQEQMQAFLELHERRPKKTSALLSAIE